MIHFLDFDWEAVFALTVSPLEIIIRGTVTYLGLFLLLRLVLKREAGTLGISDLLVVALLADAAQNAMSGGYQSLTDGFLLVSTIIFWSYALNWLGYRFPRFRRLVHPPPLLLVKEGKLLQRNMRKELITEEELKGMIREEGVEDISEVKEAYIEGDGRISVVSYGEEKAKSPPRRVE